MMHKAKKSLGQNFLKSGAVLKQIVAAGEVTAGDTVLEIGPGKGALTEKLLEKSGRVIAVEKDQDLIPVLEEKFSAYIDAGRLVLVHGDILELDMAVSKTVFDMFVGGYKIIANIPYNITGAIIRKFLTSENQPQMMVLLVQKEVAERIVARDPRHGGAGGKGSLLSISVKVYGEPKYITKVPARYFSPAPKVDSAVIKISNISRKFFTDNNIDEGDFWELARAGFAHKRKVLAGNLKTWNGARGWATLLEQSGIDRKARAEDLSLDNWRDLYKKSLE